MLFIFDTGIEKLTLIFLVFMTNALGSNILGLIKLDLCRDKDDNSYELC